MPLYRVQSKRHLPASRGIFRNPYADRERLPRDTNPDLHRTFGQWFQGRFGVDYRRRGLICTGSLDVAQGYLTVSSALIEVAPVGSYSLCFSPKCFDLYGHFQFGGRNLPENLDEVPAEMESLDYIQFVDAGLDIAADSGHQDRK